MMKKLISGLMIGLITATATMSAMAAPSHKHPVPPHAAHVDHKPMPHKGGFHKAPPKPHFNKHDVHHKFDKKDHRGFFNKPHHNGPMHKLPPKHR